MKQKKYRIGIIALIGLGVINTAVAADYSSMSTEELMNMRSQTRELSSEDQNSYRTEMRNRVQSMSDDERSSFQQMGGQDSADGSSSQNRYGQGNSSGGGGYGSGYGSRQGGGGKYRQ
ncbi:MAG: hypothetical protein PF589_07130 [Gammaproteobacteria bacterium]|jgi:hypothetical protein|nr:hypothetical protein [Gammaproteobacteria bacterium]